MMMQHAACMLISEAIFVIRAGTYRKCSVNWTTLEKCFHGSTTQALPLFFRVFCRFLMVFLPFFDFLIGPGPNNHLIGGPVKTARTVQGINGDSAMLLS